MQYPHRLVPNKDIHEIIGLLDSSHILCRRVDEDVELTLEDGKLSPDAVYKEDEPNKDKYRQTFDYSVNKIPESIVDDVYIRFFDNKKYRELWHQGTDGIVPSDEDFNYYEVKKCFLFKVKDVIATSFPYPYPKDASSEEYIFLLTVTHVPTISNISHCELTGSFTKKDGTAVELGKGNPSRKVIAAKIRSHLIRVAKFNLSDFN